MGICLQQTKSKEHPPQHLSHNKQITKQQILSPLGNGNIDDDLQHQRPLKLWKSIKN